MASKNILFIFLSIFFLSWVFINNITKEIYSSLIVLLIIVVLFLLYFIITKKFKKILIISTIWFLIWASVSQYSLNNINTKEKNLSPYFNSKNYELIFIVDSVNKIDEYKIEYIAKLEKIWLKKVNKNIKALIIIDKNYDVSIWDILKTSTKLFKFEDFNSFSYKSYMLSKNIYFKSNIYVFEIIGKSKINIVISSIASIRKKFLEVIYKIYPKEEAIFLWWILLWARDSLPDDLKTDFNNSWLTHFIAVSWFNITIIIVFLSILVKYFPVYIKAILITVWIVFFTILVWDTAPVMRASIMGLIWYYVLISGRKWNLISIILLTASIMILLSPLSLNYDVSFHLSFLAVLWIIFTNKFFEKVFYFLPNFLEIRTAFTLTLSAMSFSLPIMIFNFGQVSMLAPLANISISWTVPIAMLLGFISTIVYFVYPLAWIVVWYITWIFLKWCIIVVHFFWKLNWSLLKLDFWEYKIYLEIMYFMILIFVILWFREKEEKDISKS